LVAPPQGTIRPVAENWTPPIYAGEAGGCCRLFLAGYVHGDGSTLQEAADDLVRRLLSLVLHLRAGSGLTLPSQVPRPDLRWLGFLDELGEIAARGADIRDRIFGDGRFESTTSWPD